MAEDVGTPVAKREVESRFRNRGSAIVGTEPRFCEVDPSSAKKGITIRKLNTRSVNGSRFALPCQLGLICMHAHLMVGEPSCLRLQRATGPELQREHQRFGQTGRFAAPQ